MRLGETHRLVNGLFVNHKIAVCVSFRLLLISEATVLSEGRLRAQSSHATRAERGCRLWAKEATGRWWRHPQMTD